MTLGLETALDNINFTNEELSMFVPVVKAQIDKYTALLNKLNKRLGIETPIYPQFPQGHRSLPQLPLSNPKAPVAPATPNASLGIFDQIETMDV